MKGSLDILRGELERLFSNAALKDLCQVYLDVEPDSENLVDEAKAVFVRRVMDWCKKEGAVEALADAVMVAKKGMVDPRVKQIYQARYTQGVDEGTELGGFKVGEQLSADGVGTVATCAPIDEAAAEEDARFGVWVINGEHSRDRTAVNRFLTAVRALKTVDNPAVQKFEAAGTLDDGRPFVVVRWIEGQTLESMVPLKLVDAIDVFDALLDAVDAIHQAGLVHSDLRLGNVLICDSPEGEEGPTKIVLLGMGTDKLFFRPEPEGPGGTLTLRGVVAGMSPEVARGGVPDLRSDIYALGSTLSEMVTGKPVFQGRNRVDVLAAHLTQVPPVPSSLSDELIPGALDQLVSKLMAKEPAQRPRSLDDVRRQLGDVRRAAEEIAARAAQTGTREDIETWADALVEDPADEEILTELMNEARRCNAWGAAVEVIEEAALTADDEVIVRQLLLAGADATVRHLKDFEKAGQIYAQLLEAHPDDEELNEGMLRLLKAEGRFEELIEKLVAKAEAVEDAESKLEIIREIAAVYEEDIKDPAKAFDYYVACLGDGSDSKLVAKLEKLAERTERFEDLATACGAAVQALEQTARADATADLYKKVGIWYLERLDQANYALTCFQKVLDYRPSDTDALEAVSDLYRGAQQWNELVQVMVRLGEVEPVPEQSRDRLAEAARIHHERLSDTDEAIKLLTGVLDEDPAH
ncbi:MAG: protein kinase, partial [Deltaproteobacteria bacterium]|nr:protein kinase [Deltaproteobacteria bacterium]